MQNPWDKPQQATPPQASPQQGNPWDRPPSSPSRGTLPDQMPPDLHSDAFKAAIHSQMLGIDPGTAYQHKDEIEKQLSSQGGDDYSKIELDPTLYNDFVSGMESSVSGLVKRKKLPDKVRDQGIGGAFVSSVAELIGNAPAMLAGGGAGGVAGSEVPIVGTVAGGVAGAFALPAAMRKALIIGIKQGKVTSVSDALHRAAAVSWAAAKGAITGYATEAAGGIPVAGIVAKSVVAKVAVKGLYQAAAMTTTANLLEGRAPDLNSFGKNLAVIIPLNLITHGMAMKSGDISKAQMDVYEKDGTTPEAQAESLSAQPPVKPDLPPGLRPAIDMGNGHIEGETTETHSDLAERSSGNKFVSADRLDADPALADDVLNNPKLHDQDVIDKAWQLKSEAIDSGKVPTVYHGTKASFDEFGLTQQRNQNSAESEGIYFTRDKEMASNFSDSAKGEGSPRVIEASLGIKKPYDWNADPEGLVADDEMSTSLPPSYISKEFRSKLEAAGYDGVHWTPKEGEHDEWVVFDPKKIVQTRTDKPLSINDLYDRNAMKSGHGFATPDGKFLSPEEAKSWMKENEPDVYEMWVEVSAGHETAELHSTDYADSRYTTQARNMVRGDETANAMPPELRQYLAQARGEGGLLDAVKAGLKSGKGGILNRIKAAFNSDKYGAEAIRVLLVGPKAMFRAEGEQIVGRLRKSVPDEVDQQALHFMRDYRGDTDALQKDIEQVETGSNEKLKKYLPAMKRALEPMSPEMAQADAEMTKYFGKALALGQQVGTLESGVDPSRYSPRMFMKATEEGSAPSGGPKFSENTVNSMRREYLHTLDPLKEGDTEARTFNAFDEMSIYADRHAKAVSVKIFKTELKNSALGVEGTRDDVPAGWVELDPSSRVNKQMIDSQTRKTVKSSKENFFVPKDIADALKPLFENSPNQLYKFLHIQSVIKVIEMSLSFFHMKAMTITAMNSVGLRGYLDAMHSDNSSPDFEAIERRAALHTLTTTKTGPPLEAYKGLSDGGEPGKLSWLKDNALSKKVDEAAKAITNATFNVVQRKFKVMTWATKEAGWIAKHPNATQAEYAKAMTGYAKSINAGFGGLNWEAMGVSKATLSTARLFLLAPDWTFSNVVNAKYALMNGTAGAASRAFLAKSFATGFIMSAAASKAIGGKYDPSDIKHLDQVYLGTDKDGKEMYSNWFFAGEPKDMMTLVKRSVADGPIAGLAEFIVGKASPFAGAGIGLAVNKQGTGKPIYKKLGSTKPNGEEYTRVNQGLDQGAYLLGRVVPIAGESAVDTVKRALTDPNYEYSYTDLLDIATSAIGAQTLHYGSGAKASSQQGPVLTGQRKASKSGPNLSVHRTSRITGRKR